MAALANSSKKSFTFLYIPCDDTKDVEERTIDFKPEDEVGCLTQTLQPHFASRSGTRDSVAARETMREQLMAEAKKKGYSLDSAQQELMLERMTSCQMVDVLPMNLATRQNNWTVVSVYCDDSAVAKGLPMNMRATKLSVACGKPTRVMGDVFVARAQDDNRDLYHRLDFKKEDFAPNAKWVLKAKRQNDEKAVSQGLENLKAQAAAAAEVSSKPTARKVSSKKLKSYKADLQKWVLSKLAEYDSNESFRTTRNATYGDKNGYETFLLAKVEKKLASYSTK